MRGDYEEAGLGEGMGKGMGDRSGADRGMGKQGPVVETRKIFEPEAVFEHERLHVYRVARECLVMASAWMSRKMPAVLRDQVDRALISIVSNIAEGAAKTARADKRRFYEFAKGSTLEAAAQIDILHVRGVISAEEYAAIRPLLLRVARMLHGLCGHPRVL
jgi:four helix bundle protein